MNTDLLRGNPGRRLVEFTWPFLLASFLQTFYGMADLLIIGAFGSTADVSAVSIGSQFMHMVTVVIIGLAVGVTVKIGSDLGRKEYQRISKLLSAAWQLFTFLCLIFMALLLVNTNGITSLLQTPVQAFKGCSLYLRICFAGLPFIMAYNVFSSIFRGLGDSKSPMILVGIAALINIVLDLVFIGSLHLSVMGAALATIIAQAFSSLAALVWLKRKKWGFDLSFGWNKPDFTLMKELLFLGGPVALQDGSIQISFLIITMIANSRGLIFATAVGVSEKFISFLFLVPSSFLSSLSAFTAQNMGAGKIQRADRALKAALIICCSYASICMVLCWLIPEFFISWFSKDPAVIQAGAQYLTSYGTDTLFASIHFCFSGYFVGRQKPLISFIHNILSAFCIRIPGAWLTSRLFPDTLMPMGAAIVCGSLVSALICIGYYLWLQKTSLQKQNVSKQYS